MLKNVFTKSLSFILLTQLVCGTAFSADPRYIMISSKRFFSAKDEEKESRRSAAQLADAEAQKLALIDTKNALLSMSSKAPTSNLPEAEEYGEPDFDEVTDLLPVALDEPVTQQGSLLVAFAESEAVIYDKSHPAAQQIESEALNIFRRYGIEVAKMAQNAFKYGTYTIPKYGWVHTGPYEYLMSGNAMDAIGKAMASLAATERAAKQAAQSVWLGSVASVTNSVNKVVDTTEWKEFFEYWMQFSEHPMYEYQFYNAVSPHYNSAEEVAAREAFKNEKNFQPYAELFSKYKSITPVDDVLYATGYVSLVREAATIVSDAMNVYARRVDDARAAYNTTGNSTAYQAALRVADAERAPALQVVQALYLKIADICRTVILAQEIGIRGGYATFKYGYERITSAAFSDMNGNSISAPDVYLLDWHSFATLDFKFLERGSSFVTEFVKDISNWQKDYSSYSLNPKVTAVKVMQSGKPVYWELRDRTSQSLVMTINVPGSEFIENDVLPLGLSNAEVRETYENGKLVRADVLDLDFMQKVIVLKRPDKDRILRNKSTGQYVDAIFTDQETENTERGFRIEMKGGYVTKVAVYDDALYGLLREMQPARVPTQYLSKYKDIKAMFKDALKFNGFDELEATDGRNFLLSRARGAVLSGDIWEQDVTFTVRNDDVETEVQYQSGTHYQDDALGLHDGKYTNSSISFSPAKVSPYSNESGSILSGELTSDWMFIKSTQFNAEFGLFGALAGSFELLEKSEASILGGLVGKTIDDSDGDLGVRIFAEADTSGRRWIGTEVSYTTGSDIYIKGTSKFRFVESEDEARKSSSARIIYNLGRLLTGTVVGQESRGMSLQMRSDIQQFIVSNISQTVQQMYLTASKHVQKVIDTFKARIEPKLAGFVQGIIRSAPAIAHKVQIQGKNSPGLHLLMSNVNAPQVNTTQLPLIMGSNFVKGALLALNNMVGLN